MKKGKSPWQKYGKTAYRYSEQYQRWFAAVHQGSKSRDEHMAAQHARAHTKYWWPNGTPAELAQRVQNIPIRRAA